jgi:tetratricopeptide (TPR) repeat protein
LNVISAEPVLACANAAGYERHHAGSQYQAKSADHGTANHSPAHHIPAARMSMAALLRPYVERREAGDREGALAAARQASVAAPGEPAAHYALGEAAAALGDDDGARDAFAEALRHAPGWADAWVNLALACYRRGDVEVAKAALQQALRVDPGHDVAAGNLGALMRISGESEQSEALLRATLARAPQSAGVRLNLVADLLERERGAEALAVLDAAPEIQGAPTALFQWHLARIMALLQLGDLPAARAAMAAIAAAGPVPASLAPLFHWRRVLVAQLARDARSAATAARDMAAAIPLMGAGCVPEHRIMAHYDLARYHSGIGETQAAFAHWSAGHSLLRISQPFSRAAFAGFVEATIAAFDAPRLAAGPVASNRDATPVFITGMPRSGTTLCEQILAAHPLVHGAGERTALAQAAARLGGPRQIAGLTGAPLEAAAAAYLAALHALAPGAARIVDKMPGNELYLGLVALMLPAAKVIHCVRDPRDIGLSIWTYRFHGAHPYAHDLADLGYTIAQRARLAAHWQAVRPGLVLTVALQDWVTDFDATLARVLAHLDLPPDAACARFYESDREVRTVSRAQVREPVHGRGLGRWRAFERELAPLIAELETAGLL